MKLFRAFACVSSLSVLSGAYGCTSATPDVGATSQPIINGSLDSGQPGTFSGVGALISAGSTSRTDVFCGGTLVAPQWVLTAAHCFHDDWSKNFDIVFDFDPSVGKRRATHRSAVSGQILTPFPGPYYDSEDHVSEWGSAHDLALVKLDAPVSPNWGVRVVPIAGIAGTPAANGASEASYFAVGYGPTYREDSASEDASGTNYGLRSFSYPPPASMSWSGSGSSNRLKYSRPLESAYIGGSPGDSGGPLLGWTAQVLGVCSKGEHTWAIGTTGSFWAPVMRNGNDAFLRANLETSSGGLVGDWGRQPCVGYQNEADGDNDGIPNHCDNCLAVANTSQADPDGDGLGSACDNCSLVANPLQQDSNIEAEYEIACRSAGGVCPPNYGVAPAMSASNASIQKWHARFVGDACDPNRVARLSTADSNIESAAPGTCVNYIDKFSLKIQFNGPCFYHTTGDLLVSDGVGTPAGVTKPTLGNVEHFACDCPPSATANAPNEIERLRACSVAPYNCKIASDASRPADNGWTGGRFNRVTEADVKGSEDADASGDLMFFQAEVTRDARYGNRRGQRTARWDVAADAVRRGQSNADVTYDGMLWSHALPATPSAGFSADYVPAVNTANDYSLSRATSAKTGRTTFGGPLIPKARIPWFEWVMNPGKHRGDLGEVLVPVRINAESVRVFAFGAGGIDGINDVSARFSTNARERFARADEGSSFLVLPSADARSPLADSAPRGFSLNPTTGAVDGVFRVSAGLTTWSATSDANPPGGVPNAAVFDPASGVLTVVVDGKIYARSWNSDGFTAPELVADLGYLPLAIRPTANGGIRAVVRKGTRIYIFDANGGAVAERGRWTLRDGETWVSTGRGGETLVSFRRADGRGGVFIYGAAGVAGYLLDNVAGPAALDLAGGLTVLTDVRDDASPPVVASPPVGDRVTETALLTVMAQ